MLGIKIFLHSFRQVVGNLGMAIQVSGWFVLCLVGAVLVFVTLAAAGGGAALLAIIIGIGLLIFIIWGMSLIAVVWHRYILLEEMPSGFIPYRRGLNVWRYFWVGLGLALLGALLGFVVALVLGAFITLDTVPKVITFALIVGGFVQVLMFRMALLLPAVAIDGRLTLPDALQKTRGFIGPILVLAIINILFNLGGGYLIDMAFGVPTFEAVIANNGFTYGAQGTQVEGGIMHALVSAVFQWFVFMLSISILTTLYGHIVEKREIY
ncbi:MAG: hypothetical protein JKY31_04885 [Rhodobacteraceae bacterium]|nr:hypothetical protein [Paracoccaceae bacterium]